MDAEHFCWARNCFILLLMLCAVTAIHITDVEGPLNEGHVSKIDRKYLTKGGHYQGARHYWPFDYETQLRDIKYSVASKVKGTGVSITGNSKGFLRTNGNGWIRLGRYRNECLCNARYCRTDGLSVAMWVKLLSNETKRKVLLGSNGSSITTTTGMVIFQSTRNGTRCISALVYMEAIKWKIRFPVEPEIWFYLTVTWHKSNGLHMYKNGVLLKARKRGKYRPSSKRRIDKTCAVSLSPPSDNGSLAAYYDDLVVWNYELNSTEIPEVFKSSFENPKATKCNTTDGVSVMVYIDEKENIYGMKSKYNISWKKSGYQDKEHFSYTNGSVYRISGLEISSEYLVKVQRMIGNILLKATEITCNTRLEIPSKPRRFAVRERGPKYLFLQWQPPAKAHGTIKGYEISYRIDDFSNSEWTSLPQPVVNTAYVYGLKPFTDYIIKLLARNDHGDGKNVTLRATTDIGVPYPPRRLQVTLKENSFFIKWKEPLRMNGLVDYRLFAFVNGKKLKICSPCGEHHKMYDVDQNTTYTFWVICYNINNDSRYESKPSDNITITTPSFSK